MVLRRQLPVNMLLSGIQMIDGMIDGASEGQLPDAMGVSPNPIPS